jgi:Ni,Fe-hydrogenase I cytochrome b subunit
MMRALNALMILLVAMVLVSMSVAAAAAAAVGGSVRTAVHTCDVVIAGNINLFFVHVVNMYIIILFLLWQVGRCQRLPQRSQRRMCQSITTFMCIPVFLSLLIGLVLVTCSESHHML